MSKFYFIAVISLIISLNTYSQKVKVKKDVIVIDKQETPLKIEDERVGDEVFYNFINTATNTTFVKVEYITEEVGEGDRYQWLVLSKEGIPFKNEVDMKYLSFTLSNKKAIAEFLMKELNFFDTQGRIDNDAIHQFFDKKRVRESKEEYEASVASAKAAAAKYEETALLDLQVDAEKKRIFMGDIPYTSSSVHNKIRNQEIVENMIGSYRFSDMETLIIRDLDLYKIGTVKRDNFGKVTISSQLLSGPIIYESDNSFHPTDKYKTQRFVLEAVRHLYANGLELGRSAKEAVAQANEEMRQEALLNYEEALAASQNVYSKKGFAIDDKNVRYEGEVTLIFEEIENPNDPTSFANVVDLGGSSIGKKVKVVYLNNRGKRKAKMFSAKDGVRVCVFDEDGNETWFQGLKIMGNGILASGYEVGLGGPGSKFLKEVYKEGKAILYQEIPSNKYFLKTTSQEEVFNFEFGGLINEEKKSAKLTDYLNGCEFNNGNYDEEKFNDLEYLKTLIDFYNAANCD